MDHSVVITITACVAVALFIVGLLLKRFRTGIAIALIVLGVIATATGIGALAGIPILIVGLIFLFAEYIGRRRTRRPPP